MMRSVLALGVLLLAISGLWMAGEMHRQNCLRDERVACSVLPWDNGHAPPPKVKIGGSGYPGF